MRLMKLCLGSLVLIALDQLSKLWIVTHIGLGQVKSFLPGLVSLTYLQNRGAAFSILQNQRWFFTIITCIVVSAAIIYYIKRAPMSKLKEWALILIISGAIGNFIDRMRLSYDSLRFYEFCHFQCCRFLSIDWCCAFDDYPLERRVRWNLL